MEDETKVPIREGFWWFIPTRKGWQGRSWKWWLPNRHSFDDTPKSVWLLMIVCLGVLIGACFLARLGIL